MDRAKESSRLGHGQQRVHRRIGGAVALRARVEAPPALARDRREHREEPADRDDRVVDTWTKSDFSGAGANGHPALAAPALNTIRTARSRRAICAE